MFDFHTHIFSPWAREHRDELARRDPTFGAIYSDPKARMVGVEELLAMMEREGVRQAVICGFPWRGIEDCRRENDYLLEAASRHPGLVPFVTFPSGDEGLKELERCLKAGAKGAGELAPGTYGEGPLDGGALKELFAALREAHVPALVHVNEPVGHIYPGKGRISLRDVEVLVRAAQGVKLILAHLGGGFLFFELMPEVASICHDVYYDTAALPFLYTAKVWRLAAEIAGERLLFGTDFPLLGPKRYLQGMEEAGLSGEVRQRILSGNARRLLGWSSGEGNS